MTAAIEDDGWQTVYSTQPCPPRVPTWADVTPETLVKTASWLMENEPGIPRVACSVQDFVAAGCHGERVRVLTRLGFGELVPDRYCTIGKAVRI